MNRFYGIALLLILTFSAYAQSSDNSSKPFQPDIKGDLVVDYGFNLMFDQPSELPSSWWGSNSLGVYYTKRMRISDHLSFYPGVGLGWEKYGFKSNGTWLPSDDGSVSLDSLSGVSLAKNKIVVNYLDIPLEIRIHPSGTVDGEGWFIGIGVIGGVRFSSHTKIRYFKGGGANKDKVYNDLGLAMFRYGAQVRIGFKSFNFFYKYYFSNLFSDNDQFDGSPNPNVCTAGMSISLF